MDLKSRINEDMKNHMKSKDSLALNTVRMLKAEIKNAEIAKIGELSDDEIVKVIQSSIKKRRESAEMYSNAGRSELADKELREIDILQKYLPEQLSENEIIEIIKGVISESKEKNFGAIMKTVMAKVQGRAEGKVVSSLVKEVVDGLR